MWVYAIFPIVWHLGPDFRCYIFKSRNSAKNPTWNRILKSGYGNLRPNMSKGRGELCLADAKWNTLAGKPSETLINNLVKNLAEQSENEFNSTGWRLSLGNTR